MATRIYVVTTPKGKRLIDAVVKAQALAHVVKDEISVEIADGHQIAELVASGVKVERIGGPSTVDMFQPAVNQDFKAGPLVQSLGHNPFADRMERVL